MNDPTIHRDLGRIDATLDAQGKQIAALIESQERTEARVQAIHDVVMAARGGWKALVIVGAISSALTGLVLKLAGLVKFDP